jgi:hypothetical protein
MEQGNQLIADALREIAPGDENTFEVIEQIIDATGKVDEGQTKRRQLVFTNKQIQAEPPVEAAKCESPPVAHRFAHIDGFVDFLTKYGEEPVILADVDSLTIGAILNAKAAGGFQVVAMTPKYHPLLSPWAALFDERKHILDFAQIIMQRRRTIQQPDPRELAAVFGQVRVAKKVTSDCGTGAKNINGVMIETTIQGKKKDEYIELPDTFDLQVPIFVGTEPVDLTVDLTVLANDESVFVTATCADLEVKTAEAFDAMLDLARPIPNATVGFGRLAFAEWDRVDDAE